MSLGALLNEYIYTNCKSRKAFCDDIGFSERSVRDWCNDEKPVPLPSIAFMAEYFHEYTKEPPHVFIFRCVNAERTVRDVLHNFQRQQYQTTPTKGKKK